MTPNDLANLLAPESRTAAEHAKADILATLGLGQRIALRAVWPMTMRLGVPAAIRIVIEIAIVRYRRDLEPIIGEFVNGLADAVRAEGNPPALAMVLAILDTLRTPEATMLPAVRLAAAGVIPVDGARAAELYGTIRFIHRLPDESRHSTPGTDLG